MPGRFPELEEYWNESQGMKPWSDGTDGWVSEFSRLRVHRDDPNMWVQSFERQHGANGWASEFENVSLSSCDLIGVAYCQHYSWWLLDVRCTISSVVITPNNRKREEFRSYYCQI